MTMTTAAIPKLLTAADLYQLPDDGSRHELVRGKLITMPPPSYRHAIVTGNLTVRIGSFVLQNDLPYIGGPEAPAYIAQNPDTVRAADYALYYLRQMPNPWPDTAYIPNLIPALVVEVIAPGYGAGPAAARARMWRDAGVTLTVLADIADRAITTYRDDGAEQRFVPGDTLTLEPVLPGFACQVADIFGF